MTGAEMHPQRLHQKCHGALLGVVVENALGIPFKGTARIDDAAPFEPVLRSEV